MEPNQKPPISAEMPSHATANSTAPMMPAGHSKAPLIISLVVLAILVAVGVFYMNNDKDGAMMQNGQANEDAQVTTTTTTVTKEVSTSDDVADLKAELDATMVDDSAGAEIDNEF